MQSRGGQGKIISMNLISTIKKHVVKDRRNRLRGRRGYYASSALSCLRDTYWSMTGVPETNPTDFVGRMKMLVGTAVENELIRTVFSDLHWYGIHLEGTQVTVGPEMSDVPVWDGALDALLSKKQEDGTYQRYVLEIKTKSGYGADLLAASFEPSQEYLAQLGLYLKDLSKKGVTDQGCLFYVLMSDKNFGTLVQVYCRYDANTDEIVAFSGQSSAGESKDLDFRVKISDIEERFLLLDKHLKEGKEPKGEFKYKYDLTPELLESQSDAKLRQMAANQLVLGDWNVKYSRYKDLQLKVDKIALGYTEEEIAKIKTYYRKLHPKSRI